MRNTLRKWFTPIRPLPAGMHHYQSPADDPRNYRLHLRLEADGSGILIINAATILHLNATAAEYAYYLVRNLPADEVARQMARRYQVKVEQARQDYQDLADRILALIETPDLAPDTFLDFDRQTPYAHLSAPYRLDCALTYRMSHPLEGAAPVERVTQELSTLDWQQVLDKAWQAGVPHVIFTGGEPTLRPDLPQLIAHAQRNDQISGLISDGLRLAEAAYLDELLRAGLDHLMLILHPEDETAWIALRNALAADLFVAVHVTITGEDRAAAVELLQKLAEMGVRAVSLSASDLALGAVLQAAREQVARLGLDLVWDLPVPYSAVHPLALELQGQGGPVLEGAGRAWLYVEPDGDVLPAQGIQRVLGNLCRDPWEKIWKAH